MCVGLSVLMLPVFKRRVNMTGGVITKFFNTTKEGVNNKLAVVKIGFGNLMDGREYVVKVTCKRNVIF